MKSSQKNAFTLIEVLVAMLVLAIGLLGLAGMTVVVLRSNVLSQQISEATTISGDLMESLRLRTVAQLPDCTPGAGNFPSVSPTATDCAILTDTNLATDDAASDAAALSPIPSGNAACAISLPSPVLEDFTGGGGSTGTYDIISADLTSSGAVGSTDAGFCEEFKNLPWGQYIRYYRTFDDDSVPGTSDRRIVVVVLWKDRFGKWRKLDLQTTVVD